MSLIILDLAVYIYIFKTLNKYADILPPGQYDGYFSAVDASRAVVQRLEEYDIDPGLTHPAGIRPSVPDKMKPASAEAGIPECPDQAPADIEDLNLENGAFLRYIPADQRHIVPSVRIRGKRVGFGI